MLFFWSFNSGSKKGQDPVLFEHLLCFYSFFLPTAALGGESHCPYHTDEEAEASRSSLLQVPACRGGAGIRTAPIRYQSGFKSRLLSWCPCLPGGCLGVPQVPGDDCETSPTFLLGKQHGSGRVCPSLRRSVTRWCLLRPSVGRPTF